MATVNTIEELESLVEELIGREIESNDHPEAVDAYGAEFCEIPEEMQPALIALAERFDDCRDAVEDYIFNCGLSYLDSESLTEAVNARFWNLVDTVRTEY